VAARMVLAETALVMGLVQSALVLVLAFVSCDVFEDRFAEGLEAGRA